MCSARLWTQRNQGRSAREGARERRSIYPVESFQDVALHIRCILLAPFFRLRPSILFLGANKYTREWSALLSLARGFYRYPRVYFPFHSAKNFVYAPPPRTRALFDATFYIVLLIKFFFFAKPTKALTNVVNFNTPRALLVLKCVALYVKLRKMRNKYYAFMRALAAKFLLNVRLMKLVCQFFIIFKIIKTII